MSYRKLILEIAAICCAVNPSGLRRTASSMACRSCSPIRLATVSSFLRVSTYAQFIHVYTQLSSVCATIVAHSPFLAG